MRVAIINRGGAATGGAGKMAVLTDQWLGEAGHETQMILTEQDDQPDAVFAGNRTTRVAKAIERRTLMNEVLPIRWPVVHQRLAAFKPDVVHVHDISRAYSVDTVSLVADHYPTVWTCHDRSAATGGCISPLDCNRFETGCGHCPQFGNWLLQGRFDLTGYAWRRRRRLQQRGRVTYAVPSQWAARELQRAEFMRDQEIHVVPNALDPTDFFTDGAPFARRALGLPDDRFTIVLISHDLADVAKNPASQKVALRNVADLDPLVLAMGNNLDDLADELDPLEVRGLGFVTDARRRSLAYSAADIFVNCSLSDTFSLTTLESLASGTPVVGYASGGVAEIVTPDSGQLVTPDDADELERAIRQVAATGVDDAARDRARNRAAEFSPPSYVENYVRLYETAIEGFRR